MHDVTRCTIIPCASRSLARPIFFRFPAQHVLTAATFPLAMADATAETPGGRRKIDWEQVLEQHRGWLRTVVLARVGEPQAVDDVMQEISVAAVQQRRPLNDPGKVAPWLYQLAVRQSLLYRRRRGRRRKLEDRYRQQIQTLDGRDRAPDVLAWMAAKERRELVHRALRRLPRRDLEILLLKYVEQWSYRQMTERLGISHHAVANRLRSARKRLRAALVKLEIDESDQ